MRILILGADGMLGHQIVASLGTRHEVAGTVRLAAAAYRDYAMVLPSSLFEKVDVRNFDGVAQAISGFSPDAVVNCVGIVKQRAEANNAIESLEINSLFPHRLSQVCSERGVRLVHLSTDCVFSGKTGRYKDADLPDARDLYGRSKMMGEVMAPGVVTLRTSIIGLELSRKKSLVEWFLAQRGSMHGYRKAIFSGFTTLEMARIIERVLMAPEPVSGIYNVSSEAIDKHSLLCGIRDRLGMPVEIVADDVFTCDRSLDSARFRTELGYMPPAWPLMLDELVAQIRVRENAPASGDMRGCGS